MKREIIALALLASVVGLFTTTKAAAAKDQSASPDQASRAEATPTWTAPNADRKPRLGTTEVDFAIEELCFPYLIANLPSDQIVSRPGVIALNRQEGLYWVGNPRLVVKLSENGPVRTCEVNARRGDASQFETDFRQSISKMSMSKAIGYSYGAGAYRARELWCGPRTAAPIEVLVSFDAFNYRQPRLIASFHNNPNRDARCDSAASAPQ